ncbi:MAG: hypothetical protein ACT4ON_08330 [Bacteroidota bacterium]
MKYLLKLKLQNIVVAIILVFLCNNVFAQSDTIKAVAKVRYDTIKFINGSKQAAKIIEISDQYVKYKNPRDTLGPTFSVSRSDVLGFVLKNGCIDMEQQGYINCVKDPAFDIIKEKEFTRTIISVDAFQFLNKHFQLNIDHIFKNRKSGIGVFINTGFSDEYDEKTYKRLESTILSGGYYRKLYFNIDYKVFPYAHKKSTYFYSFAFDLGTAYDAELITIETVDSYGRKTNYLKQIIHEERYYGYRFNNGVIYRINKNFICQWLFSVGVNQYSKENKEKNAHTFYPKVSTSLLLGYAF